MRCWEGKGEGGKRKMRKMGKMRKMMKSRKMRTIIIMAMCYYHGVHVCGVALPSLCASGCLPSQLGGRDLGRGGGEGAKLLKMCVVACSLCVSCTVCMLSACCLHVIQ